MRPAPPSPTPLFALRFLLVTLPLFVGLSVGCKGKTDLGTCLHRAPREACMVNAARRICEGASHEFFEGEGPAEGLARCKREGFSQPGDSAFPLQGSAYKLDTDPGAPDAALRKGDMVPFHKP